MALGKCIMQKFPVKYVREVKPGTCNFCGKCSIFIFHEANMTEMTSFCSLLVRLRTEACQNLENSAYPTLSR